MNSRDDRDWFKAAVPWSGLRPPKALLDLRSHRHWPAWHDLVAKLVAEVRATCSLNAEAGFSRLMDVYGLLRQEDRVRPPLLLEELLAQLSPQMSACLKALEAGGAGSVADRLYTALSHEHLRISDLPSGTFEHLSPRDARSLLERLAPTIPPDPVSDEYRLFLTRVACQVELDILTRIADRFDLWRALNPAVVVVWFLDEERFVPPFEALAVRAALDGGGRTDRATLLKLCLETCEDCDQPHVAQDIRLSLLDQTLGTPFARDWLANLPRGADHTLQEANLFHRVMKSQDRGRVLLFFLDWPNLSQAVDVAMTLPPLLPDLDPWQLQRASQALEDLVPDVSLRLLRQACRDATDLLGRNDARSAVPSEPAWYSKWLPPS